MNSSFTVVISHTAEGDIEAAYVWWSENRSGAQAGKWYRSILDAISTLASMPDRCTLMEEAADMEFTVRQLLFGIGDKPTHRIVFQIRDRSVVVLRVLHTSQDASEGVFDN